MVAFLYFLNVVVNGLKQIETFGVKVCGKYEKAM
jgi:hypothetical protein